MQKFSTIFFAIFIFSLSNLLSQQLEEVVYLKNGSIIYGIIIEQVPNVSVKIKTRDGNVFFYKMEEIEKITKEASKNYSYNVGSTNYNYSEYFNLWRIGILTAGSISAAGGSAPIDKSVFAIGSIAGRRFGDIFRLGFGFEYNNYPNGTMAPLFIHFRTNVLQNQFSPIFFLDAGYSLAWIKGLDGMNGDGLFLNFGTGLEFFLSNNNSLFIEFSYRKQWSEMIITEHNYYGYYNSYSIDVQFGFLTLMLGYSF